MASEKILIIGAGPSGLVLALSLLKHGIPVRIIDKGIAPRVGERGSGIMPRSLELHKLIGTLPAILGAGNAPPLVRQFDPSDGTKVARSSAMVATQDPTPQIPYINPVLLGQPEHERILREHLTKLGGTVEYSTELRSFKQVDDYVVAELVHHHTDENEVLEEVKTPWLFGADGAHSIVRKTLGLEFLGETHDGDDVAMGDIQLKGDILETWDRWGSPASKMTFLRPTGRKDGVVQFLIAGPAVDLAKVLTSRETIVEEFYSITGRRDIVFGDLIWSSRYRPNIRMVNQLGLGRVLIGGDAAHCHSPVGAQGLNSGIQDSFNLGWKLALVQRGYSPTSLLDTYGAERFPIIAEMLGKTTELFKQVKATGVNSNRGSDLGQLGVNYRGSSIVYEDDVAIATEKGTGYNAASETAARPGDRAPGASCLIDVADEGRKVGDIYDVFSASKHTILVFNLNSSSDHSAALFQLIKRFHMHEHTLQIVLVLPKTVSLPLSGQDAEANSAFDRVLLDTEGHAYSGYHITNGLSSAVIVRPDGVVGARIHGVAGVETYFKGIFI